MTETAVTSTTNTQRWYRALIRFLMSGAFNTAATYGLYLLLMQFVSYRTSYSIAFITGVGLAYVLNRSFVFRARGGAFAMMMFPIIYLMQYMLGMGIVSIWGEVIGWKKELAPLAAIALTIPFTFLLSRRLFTNR